MNAIQIEPVFFRFFLVGIPQRDYRKGDYLVRYIQKLAHAFHAFFAGIYSQPNRAQAQGMGG